MVSVQPSFKYPWDELEMWVIWTVIFVRLNSENEINGTEFIEYGMEIMDGFDWIFESKKNTPKILVWKNSNDNEGASVVQDPSKV